MRQFILWTISPARASFVSATSCVAPSTRRFTRSTDSLCNPGRARGGRRPRRDPLLPRAGAWRRWWWQSLKPAGCNTQRAGPQIRARITRPRSHASVGEGGLEPPRPEGHWHLKPARLPFRHSPERPAERITVRSVVTLVICLASAPASGAGRAPPRRARTHPELRGLHSPAPPSAGSEGPADTMRGAEGAVR